MEPNKQSSDLLPSLAQSIIANLEHAIAYHKIVVDESNKPIDYIFLDCNKKFEEFTGLKKENIINKKVTEAIPGIEKAKPDLIGIYGKVALTGEPAHLEIFFEPLKKWYSISAFSPEKEYFVVIFSDITIRKTEEDELHRTTRAIKAISECNQVIIHGGSEDEILQKVCEKIIAIAGYKLAWVGKPENDEPKSVTPVAQAGFEEGYLKNIKISWADNEYGRGPTGLSLRNREVAVMQNMATNPAFAPWREEALKRGYNSSICLPLIIDNETMSLCIYSSEVNAFDEEEVKLLKELVNDLSYGISSIRTRLKREEAEKAKLQSEEKFAKAFNSSPITITVADLKTGVLIEANPAFETLTGYYLSEAIGKTGNELNLFPNPGEREKMVEEIRKNQKARDIDFVLRDKNGALHNVKVSSDIVKFGNTDCILSTIIDFTKDKENQEALARSEHHLNEAQRIAKIGNWDWDAVKDKIWWSKEYYNLYGLDPNQPTPNYEEHLKAYTAETAKRLDAAVKKSTETGEPYEVELELAHPTTTTRWVLARGETIRDNNGKIVGLRGTSQDITKDKEAEQKLRTSEEYFHSIILSMEEGVVFQDKDGKISFANPTAEKILGLKSEELTGQTSSDRARESKIIHEDGTEFPGDEHPAMVTLKTGKPQTNIIMGLHKPDGALTWISINSQPLISSGEDKPHAVLTTFRDITEQKKAEEAIRQANIYNRNLIETSLDPMLTVSSEGDITDVNHAFELATGLGKDKLIGTKVNQYFSDPDKVTEGLRETIAKGFVRDYRVAIKNQSGNAIDTIWNTILYKNEKGEVQGVFAAARDITQLKKTEVALKEAEERYKNYIENSSDIVYAIDQTGLILYLSPQIKRFGYAPEELMSKQTIDYILMPEEKEEVMKKFKTIIENQNQGSLVLRFKDKTGHLFWLEASGTVQKDLNGTPTGSIGVIRDITERKLAEDRLKELDSIKSRFIRVVSHQLRTPLSAIRWQLESMLNEPANLNELQKQMLHESYRADLDIISTINDLTTALDIEEGRAAHLDKTSNSLLSLWDSIEIDFAKKCQTKGITLETKKPETPLPLIEMDTEKIRSVMEKIADNALIYTKEKGKIIVSIEKPDSILLFKIIDTGIGIPPTEKNYIMQRFYRGSNAIAIKPDAAGLGLYIAKNFVESHGGKLNFTSEEGKGSTFWFELPLNQ